MHEQVPNTCLSKEKLRDEDGLEEKLRNERTSDERMQKASEERGLRLFLSSVLFRLLAAIIVNTFRKPFLAVIS